MSQGGLTPSSTAGPTGTTPAQIRHAYGFDQISFANGTIPGDGRGTTIAIVDAYDDPNIANDLHQFDLRFGLPDPTFTKVNQSGGSSLPAASSDWAPEISLDVEWAHAIAPKANILLVEANDNSDANLFAAAAYAAKQPGVVVVSMSFGGGEDPSETGYDSTFTTPSGHGGVTFVASSGDNGAPASYPATSPNVLAVGGTTLNLDSAGNILSESGWSGSGGGISTVESQPAYQKGVVTQSSTFRTNPDVSYDADPNTGFPIYDSYNNPLSAPWAQYGGTSDAAPQWSALIAITDQGRALAGLSSLDGATQTLPKIYALPATDFHDIVGGTSTGTPNYTAVQGYDLVTGRGSPYANQVVADLIGQSTSPVGSTQFSVTASASSTAGTSFNLTVTALQANGSPYTSYAGTVHFTSSDTLAGLPADFTFTAAGNKGTHTFSVTLKTAGSETVTVTDKVNSSLTGTTSVTVNPAAASKLVFGQQPTNTAAGTLFSPAVTVLVEDAFGNVVTTDNSDKVTLAFGSNPGGAALGGSTTVTVSGGVATFSNLTISKVGNGYTLKATAPSRTAVTSASFSITTASSTKVIEDFETSRTYNVVGTDNVNFYLAPWAAHDGNNGLDAYGSEDWIYRNDAGAQVKAGDTLSVWLAFPEVADGRAYFGFGSSPLGTLSLVAAPNTGQLIIQQNINYGFVNLAAVNQTFQAGQWYRLEVDWGKSGTIVGKLFDSDGKTLLQTVTAATTQITSGGIAFRSTNDYDTYFDTVTDTSGVNGFTAHATPLAVSGMTSAQGGNVFLGEVKGALGLLRTAAGLTGGDTDELGLALLQGNAAASLQANAPAPAGTFPGFAVADEFFSAWPAGSGPLSQSPGHTASSRTETEPWALSLWAL